MANNQTSSTSFGGAAFGGVGLVGGGMSSIKGTPMEPIIRDVLARVASFTATKLVAGKAPESSPAVGLAPAAAATASQ